MTDNSPFPLVVSAGEALTDLVRTGRNTWASHAGGAGWNVARAVATLGVPAAFAGAVGADVFGEDIARVTLQSGLDARFLQVVDSPTLLAVVHQVSPPAYYFLGENSADLRFSPADLPGGWLDAVKWLHLGGISLARQPLSATLLNLAEQARDRGARISFDPNARVVHRDPAYRPVLERTIRLSDLIKFSDEDLRFFFPDQSEPEVVSWIRERNEHAPLIITRGAEGVTLDQQGRREDYPAVRVNVVDTVGAGDAFVAGLLYAAVQERGGTHDWGAHVQFALKVAAVACTRAGAFAPSRADVSAL